MGRLSRVYADSMKPPEVREATARKRGHYRAYDAERNVIWEKKDFTVGIDAIPLGLSIGMKACTITDGKKVIHTWDPWDVLQ